MFLTLRKLISMFDARTRTQLIFIFGVMVLSALLETIGIGLIVPIIAVITDIGNIEGNIWLRRARDLIGASNPTDFLIFMSAGLVVFYIVKNIGLGFLNYIQARFVFSKRSMLGKKILASYLYRPYIFHLERNTAELLRNITFEVANVYNFVQGLLKFGAESCLLTGVILMLMLVSPEIVFYSAVIMGIVSGILYKSISNYLKVLGQKVQLTQMLVSQAVLEGFGSIKEVKLSKREDFFPERYYASQMENSRANWRYSTINMFPRLCLEVVAVGSVGSIIVILQIQGKDLKVLLPTLGLFAMAAIRLIPSLSQIVSNLQLLRFNSPAVDLIYEDMKYYNSLSFRELSQKPLQFAHKIEIRDLSYIYPNSEESSLRRVSMDIIKGQAVAFAGSSGAGKTTLANLILGLLTPSEGCISVDNQNIFQNISAWQQKIGYVPQSIYLLDASINSNIAFGREENEIDDEKVRKAVETAQLETFVNGLSDGLRTLIGENGIRLSGGQRQRLGIARALYHDPEILILDEATSSLDGRTEKEVGAAIESMSGKKTMIIIAHRLSTIQKCDRIYYLKNGTVAGFGTFNELMQTNADFRRMAESGTFKV